MIWGAWYIDWIMSYMIRISMYIKVFDRCLSTLFHFCIIIYKSGLYTCIYFVYSSSFSQKAIFFGKSAQVLRELFPTCSAQIWWNSQTFRYGFPLSMSKGYVLALVVGSTTFLRQSFWMYQFYTSMFHPVWRLEPTFWHMTRRIYSHKVAPNVNLSFQVLFCNIMLMTVI